MASAPMRRCTHCRRLVQGRCEQCAKANNRKRYSQRRSDPFYSSKAWRDLRAAHLQQHPLCEDCKAKGRTVPATAVDHIEDRCDAPHRELDPTNLSSKCVSCHNRKTARTQARRRRETSGKGGKVG